MNEQLKAVFDMLTAIRRSADISTKRHFEDFFSDKLVQSMSESNLIDAVEHMAKCLNISTNYIGGNTLAKFAKASSSPESQAILQWIRRHPKVSAMICFLKDEEDYKEALSSIDIGSGDATDQSVVEKQPVYDIPICAELLAPLAHGSDNKAGNATLFRRRQVITSTGAVKELPFYAGNAVRGLMRDLLADDFLHQVGLTPRRDKPPVNIWFFHTIYSGGVLEEQSKAMESINKELGKSGTVRTDGMRRLRDMIPIVSLLGAAIGNRIIQGRICVGDLRPQCREWGTGNVPVAELMEWSFITRHDNYEGRGDDEAHSGMIANTEVLKAGTILQGGIDVDTHTRDIEKAVLGRGLQLLSEYGAIGAENRRGLGKSSITIDNVPDETPYLNWITENKKEVLEYLQAIGATVNQEDLFNASS